MDNKRRALALVLSGASTLPVWKKPIIENTVLPAHASTSCIGNILSGVTYSQGSLWSQGVTNATPGGMTNGQFDEASETGTDGNLATDWVKMDLGAISSVCSVVVGCDFNTTLGDDNWGPGYTENCDVQYSNDDSSWTTAFNTGSFTQGIQTYATSFNARYIRIVNGDFDGSFLVVTEFHALVSSA